MINIISSRFTPLNKKITYVVGVSGGPDSMFLLDKMRKLKYSFVVAHVNYNKRKDSNFDQIIVRNYCQKYQISFFLKKVDYANVNKENFQSFARKIRYNFFSDLCQKVSNEGAIVVAHNLEDLIETFYIQKKRNSVVNFWGILFESSWGKFKIYRPVLSFTKSTILNYLKKENVSYAIDYTNEKDTYLRNFFRKKIMPMSVIEKTKTLLEIDQSNVLLSKKLNFFNFAYNKVIFENKILFNNSWKDFDFEIKKRIIYSWVNNFSSNNFSSRKKNTISELVKQFESSSKKIVFIFKSGFKIEKHENFALISKI